MHPLLPALLQVFTAVCTAASFPSPLVILGDSYSELSFNSTSGAPLPSPLNPTGNPPYPGLTASNGPNWVDVLTFTINSSVVVTWDFAYGGATSDNSLLVNPGRPGAVSLREQVVLALNAKVLSGRAAVNGIVVAWGGVNDLLLTYQNTTSGAALRRQLLASYRTGVEELVAAGARRVLIMGAPPLARSPKILSLGSADVAAMEAATADWNRGLQNTVLRGIRRHRGVRASFYDVGADVFTPVLDDPGKYGLVNVTTFCEAYAGGTPAWNSAYESCGGVAVDRWVWLNDVHPGMAVHALVAKGVKRFVESVRL
ncbi:hypothetical protein EDC01DRAFT_682918 [Geopyxis carbonaria]|nr:hypothetical protein EDC01DRAFT_682918 [Geopyxis carbonaria]